MARSLLIPAAALAALIVPAGAQAFDNHSVSSVTVHSLHGGGDMRGDGRHFGNGLACDSRGGRDRDRRLRGGGSGCTVFADSWGYYDPDFNRSWDSDSYNDWWHDRPDRAFPRWVQHNEACAPDRMWWSGSGWHC